MKDISVIIPVYNREKYISKCLESVINSSAFQRCQVIVIDDGSTDKSAETVKRYSEQYDNIYFYSFPHSGVSKSRNEGLKRAEGKYIYFLDSDDFVEPHYIEKLFTQAQDRDCDIVFAGYSVYEKNGSVSPVERDHLSLGEVMNGCEYAERRMDAEDWLNQPWCAIYNREFLLSNNLIFPENIAVYEDLYFTNEILLFAKRVYMIPEYGYMYRSHRDSLVQNGVKDDHIDCCLEMMEMFRKEYKYLEKAQRHAIGRVWFQFISMILYCIGDTNSKKADEFYLRLSNMELFIPLLKSVSSLKEAAKWLIFRVNWRLYYKTVKKN